MIRHAPPLLLGASGPLPSSCDVITDVHCVSKSVPRLTCYNLDIHDPIPIIFGRSVTKKVRNQMLCFPASAI